MLHEGDGGEPDSPHDKEAPGPAPEVAILGKGLTGALQLSTERGYLKETDDWCGCNMDKKMRKPGNWDCGGVKQIMLLANETLTNFVEP